MKNMTIKLVLSLLLPLLLLSYWRLDSAEPLTVSAELFETDTYGFNYIKLTWSFQSSQVKAAFLSAPINYERLNEPIPDINGNLDDDHTGDGEGAAINPIFPNGGFGPGGQVGPLGELEEEWEQPDQMMPLVDPFLALGSAEVLGTLDNSVRGLFKRYQKPEHGNLPKHQWIYCLEPTNYAFPDQDYGDATEKQFCYGSSNEEVGMNYFNMFLPRKSSGESSDTVTLELPKKVSAFQVFYLDQLSRLHCQSVTINTFEGEDLVTKSKDCS